MINTSEPRRASYAYYVTIEPNGENRTMTVECVYGQDPEDISFSAPIKAANNGKIMAHYIRTGEIRPDQLSPIPVP